MKGSLGSLTCIREHWNPHCDGAAYGSNPHWVILLYPQCTGVLDPQILNDPRDTLLDPQILNDHHERSSWTHRYWMIPTRDLAMRLCWTHRFWMIPKRDLAGPTLRWCWTHRYRMIHNRDLAGAIMRWCWTHRYWMIQMRDLAGPTDIQWSTTGILLDPQCAGAGPTLRWCWTHIYWMIHNRDLAGPTMRRSWTHIYRSIHMRDLAGPTLRWCWTHRYWMIRTRDVAGPTDIEWSTRGISTDPQEGSRLIHKRDLKWCTWGILLDLHWMVLDPQASNCKKSWLTRGIFPDPQCHCCRPYHTRDLDSEKYLGDVLLDPHIDLHEMLNDKGSCWTHNAMDLQWEANLMESW